jgi:hypothetical protein
MGLCCFGSGWVDPGKRIDSGILDRFPDGKHLGVRSAGLEPRESLGLQPHLGG